MKLSHLLFKCQLHSVLRSYSVTTVTVRFQDCLEFQSSLSAWKGTRCPKYVRLFCLYQSCPGFSLPQQLTYAVWGGKRCWRGRRWSSSWGSWTWGLKTDKSSYIPENILWKERAQFSGELGVPTLKNSWNRPGGSGAHLPLQQTDS